MPLFEALELVFCMVIYIICGKGIIINAVKNLLHGEFLDENFLMSVSSIGAICLGEFSEATAIMILYQIGEKFEDYAVDKSHKSIEEISKLRPDKAYVLAEEKAITSDSKVMIVGAGLVVSSFFGVVPTGYTGILRTVGRVENYTLSAGLNVIKPWQDVVLMDNREQKIEFSQSAFSSDIQQVDIKGSVIYSINH